jgi:hypothetical protein
MWLQPSAQAVIPDPNYSLMGVDDMLNSQGLRNQALLQVQSLSLGRTIGIKRGLIEEGLGSQSTSFAERSTHQDYLVKNDEGLSLLQR